MFINYLFVCLIYFIFIFIFLAIIIIIMIIITVIIIILLVLLFYLFVVVNTHCPLSEFATKYSSLVFLGELGVTCSSTCGQCRNPTHAPPITCSLMVCGCGSSTGVRVSEHGSESQHRSENRRARE